MSSQFIVRDILASKLLPFLPAILGAGCSKVDWLFPKETVIHQPIIIAKK